MNEHQRNDADQSTILRLGQFVPDQPLAGPDQSASPETVTAFVVRQAAPEVCQQSAQPVVAPKDGNALSPQSLLGVVSYCYAKDVCSSAEIERKLVKDPAIRAACGSDLPDRRILRRFRRLNRAAIRAMLEKIFRFRRRKEKAAWMAAAGASSNPACEPGESTIMFARQEAEARIEKAVFVDDMEKDD